MKRMKFLFPVLFVLMSGGNLFAQSIAEGKKFLYYDRHTSAQAIFEKMVAANPNDEAAIYYLGQSMLAAEHQAQAKNLYLQKLSANPNSPLLLAGIGHIELLEGKNADARSRFETAISLSKGDANVLNAVGYANGNPDIKNGDAAYAVSVLKRASETKTGSKDPEIWTNLGDAYRKLGNGGDAVRAYEKALSLDNNYARASFRIGRIYQSQGRSQEKLYMDYYNQAIAKDAAYSPVYFNLMNYFFATDVGKSAQYMDQWLNTTDADEKACYYRASMKYAQKLYNDAISQADKCIAEQGKDVYPNLYGLKGISYFKLGDSLKAKQYYEEYFQRQDISRIGGGDYSNYAEILLKFPGNEVKAAELVQKAIEMDTVPDNKVAYVSKMAKAFEDAKDYRNAGIWYAKVMDVKPNYTNLDLYRAGNNFYYGKAFDSASKYFTLYVEKYPDNLDGIYWMGNTMAAIDSTSSQGAAAPHYQKLIELGEANKTNPNTNAYLTQAYNYFINYYANVKRDNAKALEYVEKALVLDPTNQQMLQNKALLSKSTKAAPKK